MNYIIHRGTRIIKSFPSEQGAKCSLSRKWKKKYPDAEVHSQQYFNEHIDHLVEVNNLLSGKPVKIRASEVGGCCDPSTERYHCC